MDPILARIIVLPLLSPVVENRDLPGKKIVAMELVDCCAARCSAFVMICAISWDGSDPASDHVLNRDC